MFRGEGGLLRAWLPPQKPAINQYNAIIYECEQKERHDRYALTAHTATIRSTCSRSATLTPTSRPFCHDKLQCTAPLSGWKIGLYFPTSGLYVLLKNIMLMA